MSWMYEMGIIGMLALLHAFAWELLTRKCVEHRVLNVQHAAAHLAAPLHQPIGSVRWTDQTSLVGAFRRGSNKRPSRRDPVGTSTPCVALGSVGHPERPQAPYRRRKNNISGLKKLEFGDAKGKNDRKIVWLYFDRLDTLNWPLTLHIYRERRSCPIRSQNSNKFRIKIQLLTWIGPSKPVWTPLPIGLTGPVYVLSSLLEVITLSSEI